MKIKISFFAVMLLLSLIMSTSRYAHIPLLAAAMHEVAHIICAKIRGVRVKKFELSVFGAKLDMDSGIYSYSDEIAVCAAGPCVNLLSADLIAILCHICKIDNYGAKLFILASLSLGIVNLLPIKSFDGGRILFALISKFSTLQTAERTLEILSFLSLFFIWCVSLYLLLRTSSSLSLFVFSISVFSNIFIGSGENTSN